MANTDKQNELLQMLAKKLNQSPEQIKQSAQSGNIDSLLGSMPAAQQDKVKSVLNNPEETRKIMENPQVQALIRMLNGNG